LDGIGVRDLVRSIEHLGDKNVSTTQKVTRVVVATVNLAPIDGEGEREPSSGMKEPTLKEPEPILDNSTHKNSNDYTGHQGVYDIKVDGELYKYGKADMTKTSKTTGEPKRLQSQLNKLQKENPLADIQGKILHQDKNITTKEIKKVETQKIQEYKNKNGKNPPGNQNHPGIN